MRRIAALAALMLASCGGKKDDPAPDPKPRLDASTLACKPAPECMPARDTGWGATCRVGGHEVTCEHCGPGGGLLSCVDTDQDGCVELVRTECGRLSGCEMRDDGPACKKSSESLNLFGAETPAGFVVCDKGSVFPVKDGKIVAVVRTRAMFVGPTTWSVALAGTTPTMIPAEYVDVEDTHGVLRQEVEVGDATEVELVYTVKDYLSQIRMSCGPVTLQR